MSGTASQGGRLTIGPQELPVMLDCDVLVCGAGMTGCAAAVAAARAGCKTVLLERWSFPGGMATAAMVNILHTSDREKEVIFGFVQEVVAEGMARGFCERYDHFPRNHETYEFQSEGMKAVLDDLLAGAGVQPIYTLVAGDVVTEGERVVAILCDTKTGRKAITAQAFIDCTGDGDVAARAGVPFDIGRESDGRVQGMTLIYGLCGVDRERVSAMTGGELEGHVARMREEVAAGRMHSFGPISFPYYAQGGHPNMNPAAGDPLDEMDLTRCLVQTRKQMHEYVNFWRSTVPGFERARIYASGAALGVRESRRFRCRKRLTAEDVVACRKQEDAIGHGFWMIDIHDPGGSGYTSWQDGVFLPAGESYHIPYGMLVPEGFSNLLIAGRCASSSHEAHASVRLQSHCMVMGQGAGTAAAMALEEGCGVGEVEVGELQRRLMGQGVYIEA